MCYRDANLVLVPQPIGTHGADITPRSHVVRKDFQFLVACHRCSLRGCDSGSFMCAAVWASVMHPQPRVVFVAVSAERTYDCAVSARSP